MKKFLKNIIAISSAIMIIVGGKEILHETVNDHIQSEEMIQKHQETDNEQVAQGLTITTVGVTTALLLFGFDKKKEKVTVEKSNILIETKKENTINRFDVKDSLVTYQLNLKENELKKLLLAQIERDKPSLKLELISLKIKKQGQKVYSSVEYSIITEKDKKEDDSFRDLVLEKITSLFFDLMSEKIDRADNYARKENTTFNHGFSHVVAIQLDELKNYFQTPDNPQNF